VYSKGVGAGGRRQRPQVRSTIVKGRILTEKTQKILSLHSFMIFILLFGASCSEDPWVNRSGEPALIREHAGDAHCGLETVTFIVFEDERYARDPEFAVDKDALSIEYDPDVALPKGTRDTGLRKGETQLWVGGSSGEEAIYLVEDDEVERLPLFSGGCE
jgi:hypothetical protein